ncbi:mRNA interferase RelE/StbE [Rathayibacter oskolensis]|uniref:mRNA interferase RelE/StbE n=1 Tax=Rathayibacter oskolensis TaxID=1891671 RepID=A0A1X7P861_9MICO|nr:type II toxin-antitoxin system RelE/ParE family toxin [Rathayibacter oskolensis]SMH47171.1 mRNA interferase RelE/StbE [Rathayibacter oskolensis]
MSYSIVYSRAAAKAFRGIHPNDQRSIKAAVEGLTVEPRPPGAIQLVGGGGEYRVRVGDYRIVYDIQDGELVILVLRVAHRREVYR